MNTPWLRAISNKGTNPKFRLFCFPHAGGGASIFKKWIEFLPDNIELYALQLPGREDRIHETPVSDLNLILRKVTAEILKLVNIPYALLGHSLGGIIAFELAKLINKLRYRLPDHLFIVSRESPECKINNINKDSSNEEIIKYIERQKWTSDNLLHDTNAISIFLPIIKSDLLIDSEYTAFYKRNIPLDCPISVFLGKDEYDLDLNAIKDWAFETTKHFNIKYFNGNHFFLHNNIIDVLTAIYKSVFTTNDTPFKS